MARSKIKKKDTIQIASLAGRGKASVKKSSSASVKNKAPRSDKQQEAARKNIQKAREAKENYRRLQRQGFTNDTIWQATNVIENYLAQEDFMRSENNPAVARLYEEIGTFKTQEELSSMTKGEFYKYATSIRSFLNNPLSVEEANLYLWEGLRSGLIRAELTEAPGESHEAYLNRRKAFIRDREQIAAEAFQLYRRVMETNAGQIIKAKMSPAAYGSDNLIADIFDFVTGGFWSDRDLEKATAYWNEIIQQQYEENLQFMQSARTGEAIEINNFNWRGVMAYDTFIRPKRKK